MNNKRRKQIADIGVRLSEELSNLEEVLEEERDYFDNIPENLQDSERALESERATDLLMEAMDLVSEAISILEEVE